MKRAGMVDRGGQIEIMLPYATLEPIRELLLQMFVGEKFGQDAIWETHLANVLWNTDLELEAVLEGAVGQAQLDRVERARGPPLEKGHLHAGSRVDAVGGFDREPLQDGLLQSCGGGAIAVPLQQSALKLPLKTCIANSSTIICVSATIGAIYKNVTLVTRHGYDWRVSLMLAALLAPTCWIGGRLGPALTQRLPVRWVRVAFILLLIAAIARLVMPVVEMKGTGS